MNNQVIIVYGNKILRTVIYFFTVTMSSHFKGFQISNPDLDCLRIKCAVVSAHFIRLS